MPSLPWILSSISVLIAGYIVVWDLPISATTIIWVVLFGVFYAFSNPFAEKNRELRACLTQKSLRNAFAFWLLLAVGCHLPSLEILNNEADIRVAVSTFFPIFLASFSTLCGFLALYKLVQLLLTRVIDPLFGSHAFRHSAKWGEKKRKGEMWLIMRSSFLVTILCCTFYSHCGSTILDLATQTHNNAMDSEATEPLDNGHVRGGGEVEKLSAGGYGADTERKRGVIGYLRSEVCETMLSVAPEGDDFPLFQLWQAFGEHAQGHTRQTTTKSTSRVDSGWSFIVEAAQNIVHRAKISLGDEALLSAGGGKAKTKDEEIFISSVFSLWATGMAIVLTNGMIERTNGFRMVRGDSLISSAGRRYERKRSSTNSAMPMSLLRSPERASAKTSVANDDIQQQWRASLLNADSDSEDGEDSEDSDGSGSSDSREECSSPMIRSVSLSMLHLEDAGFKELPPTSAVRAVSDQPNFLPMVPWWSLVVSETAFDLFVSMKFFLGRFDQRIMQAALSSTDLDHVAPNERRDNFIIGDGDIDGASAQLSAVPVRTKSDGGTADVTSTQDPPSNQSKKRFSCSSVGVDSMNIGGVYDHFSESNPNRSPERGHWFDWMADTGDGGDSTYAIARLLAQPFVDVSVQVPENRDQWTRRRLPRGHLLVVGGDLCYPNPSSEAFERRLFYPFECAMEPPSTYNPDSISTNKPAVPDGGSLDTYAGPQMFIIPGNHDWFDGLDSFLRFVCHRDWLGGWLMPQEKSYFALSLPKGWWILGLDLALQNDIDTFQFKYFALVAERHIKPGDQVIVATHEPTFVLDAYNGKNSAKNVAKLMQVHLPNVALRIAGDLHNYMRFSPVARHSSAKAAEAPDLIVQGGGGAFLHPTHTFPDQMRVEKQRYKKCAAFPDRSDSLRLGRGNVLGFRRKNWRFDVVAVLFYFFVVVSVIPLCSNELDPFFAAWEASGGAGVEAIKSGIARMQPGVVIETGREFAMSWWNGEGTGMNRTEMIVWAGNISREWWNLIAHMFGVLIGSGLVSPVAVALMTLIWCKFTTAAKFSSAKRYFIGVCHSAVHVLVALKIALALELAIEALWRSKLVGPKAHSLFRLLRAHEASAFSDFITFRVWMEKYSLGLYPNCIKWIMALFDVPEAVAVSRAEICRAGFESTTRATAVVYYGGTFSYYVLFAAPACGLVLGIYLWLSVNFLNIHWDEAFSSLRNKNFKSITRFHITDDGDLEVFTLGVRKVPDVWERDPRWMSDRARRSRDGANVQASHELKYPSRYMPGDMESNDVRLVDYHMIKRRKSSKFGSAPSIVRRTKSFC